MIAAVSSAVKWHVSDTFENFKTLSPPLLWNINQLNERQDEEKRTHETLLYKRKLCYQQFVQQDPNYILEINVLV
jgi:hypothetical protein